jgi:hypothetical protein
MRRILGTPTNKSTCLLDSTPATPPPQDLKTDNDKLASFFARLSSEGGNIRLRT